MNIPLDDIKIVKEIASGGFCRIYLGIHLSTSEVLAVKEVKTESLAFGAWRQCMQNLMQ
jgi:hypothetical protein